MTIKEITENFLSNLEETIYEVDGLKNILIKIMTEVDENGKEVIDCSAINKFDNTVIDGIWIYDRDEDFFEEELLDFVKSICEV